MAIFDEVYLAHISKAIEDYKAKGAPVAWVLKL